MTESNPSTPSYRERPLTKREKLFAARLTESNRSVVPATVRALVEEKLLKKARQLLCERYRDLAFSEFEILGYVFARAASADARFRTTSTAGETLREYQHLNLGIAVAAPNDELYTAVVNQSETLSFDIFVEKSQQAVVLALQGKDQIRPSTQVLFSYMSDQGITDAIPTVVAPAVSVVTIGAPFDSGNGRFRIASLTFDHRYINGFAAARLLERFTDELKNIISETTTPMPGSPGPSNRPDGELRPNPTGTSDAILVQAICEVLGIARQDLHEDIPLRNQGLSSLKSVELAGRLKKVLGVDLPATLIWNYPTVRALSDHLGREVVKPEPVGLSDKDLAQLQQVISAAGKSIPGQADLKTGGNPIRRDTPDE